MAEAIDRIKDGDTPRNLNAPPGGALGIRNVIAEIIDKIIHKMYESIEITYDRMGKLLNEKIGNSEEKTNNNMNIDKDREQNTKEAWKILNEIINDDNDSDKQKTNKNDGIDNVGSKDTHKDNNKTKDKIVNSKDNKKNQEEIKTTNGNNTKDSRERQNRNLSNKNRGRECRYFINDSCRYGRICKYIHREVCRGWKRNGNCGNSKYTFDHPEPCMNHLKGTCQRRSCWYLHTLERTDPKQDMQQEKPTSMQNMQKHNEVSWKQNHNQHFWNGQNRGQEIQKKKTPEEEKTTTQQQSIDLMMGAMETLRLGLEQILLKTNKH